MTDLDRPCWHTLRVMGARELVRRRLEAGWPPENRRAARGWHVACTTCLATVGAPPHREGTT